MICSMAIVLKWHTMIGYSSYTNGQLLKKIMFWGSKSHPISAKVMQPSVQWFALWGYFWNVVAWKNKLGRQKKVNFAKKSLMGQMNNLDSI